MKAKLLRTASPELARFDGIVVQANHRGEEREVPHIHVNYKMHDYRFTVPGLDPMVGSENAPDDLLGKLTRWFKTPVPVPEDEKRKIADLVLSQVERALRLEETERVPTPAELKAAAPPTPPPDPSKVASDLPPMIPFNKYAVRSLKPLPDYKLEVTFTNGVTKVVNIGELLGDDKRAGAVWNDFDNVKHGEYLIYWGKGLQQYEFEARELWREGKPIFLHASRVLD
jgi:hypothetical protein